MPRLFKFCMRIIAVWLCAVLFFPSISLAKAKLNTDDPPAAQSLKMLFAGDVMTHEPQLKYHLFGGKYDFKDDYKYIKSIVSAADIAAANFEMATAGHGPYTGFPWFNTPDSISDALLYAGFDVLATANNHMRDLGDSVMKRTSKLLRKKGFGVIGTVSKPSEKKFLMIEKNGIKAGFINFTMHINRGITSAASPYICYFSGKDNYLSGLNRLKSQLNELKKMGAEFITVFMHWGNEYKTKNSSLQKSIAHRIADIGADLIIGAHPHVIQNAEAYSSKKSGKKTLIYYSLGNLVSNMYYTQRLGKGYCETGALALVKLVRKEDGSVAIDSSGYLTTYMHKPCITKKFVSKGRTYKKHTRAYYIVPASLVSKYPSRYKGARGSLLSHIRQGVKNGKTVLGASGKKIKLFNFREYTTYPW